jgi:hypothetical protein
MMLGTQPMDKAYKGVGRGVEMSIKYGHLRNLRARLGSSRSSLISLPKSNSIKSSVSTFRSRGSFNLLAILAHIGGSNIQVSLKSGTTCSIPCI